MFAQVGVFGASWAILAAFRYLLGTLLLAESTPDAQDAVRTPKTIPQRPIFKDWVINFAPIFKHAFHILRLFLCYPPALLPQLIRFSPTCSLGKSGAGGRGEAFK